MLSKSFLTQPTANHFDHLKETAIGLQPKVPIPICHTCDPTTSLNNIVNIVYLLYGNRLEHLKPWVMVWHWTIHGKLMEGVASHNDDIVLPKLVDFLTCCKLWDLKQWKFKDVEYRIPITCIRIIIYVYWIYMGWNWAFGLSSLH